MTKTELIEITGGLSNPSKMPGKAISIPAKYCQTGGKLRHVPGSVCSDCYACKNMYRFPNVQNALERRYVALQRVLTDGRGSESWVTWLNAMERLIGSDRFFRFHDSGDIQGIDHLMLYADLARRMPHCRFWLPTKETQLIKRADLTNIPENMTIRLSATMVDGPAPASGGLPVSMVWTADKIEGTSPDAIKAKSEFLRGVSVPDDTVLCPASKQDNKCGDCRACWDPNVSTVIYQKH